MLKCVDEDVDAGDAARSSNAAIVCATVAFALLFILQCLYSTTQKNQTAYAIPSLTAAAVPTPPTIIRDSLLDARVSVGSRSCCHDHE